ncbi:MAG: C2H2-type zinc finger protein [Candidatus Bathyarchaeota archaeon]
MSLLKRKYTCKTCGKTFQSKERLENHKKTHKKEK